MAKTYGQLYPSTGILHSIWYLEAARETRRDVRKYALLNVDKWVNIVLDEEIKLCKAKIFNDVEAIAYMDRVEPIFKEYLMQYKFMIQRHQEEIERMLGSFRP